MSSPAKAITTGTLGLGIAAALVLALPIDWHVGSVLGATTDEEPAPPVAFTATWGFGGQIRSGRIETSDGITHETGFAWRPTVISEATDPRLRGTLSIAANLDDYSAAGGPSIHSYAFRIENDDGAWQQPPTINLETGDGDVNTTTGVLVGEGGYEGFIAVFDNLVDDSGWTLDGYIIEGQLPPPPEPVVSE